jgi:hypothetical protein
MANNIATNVWRIDTAGASPVKTGGGPVYVSALEFSGYAVATDRAVVTATDAAGVTFNVCVLQGNADLSPISTNLGKAVWIRGLAVPTLTAGQVSVYLG